MNKDVIAEIEARPRISALARDMITSSAEAMSAMGDVNDRIEAEALMMLLREHDRSHDDRAALLAIVRSQQSEIDALTDDISRALETIAAENEARVAAEKREAALREALSFYADPESYFAIALWTDPPCGEFADDLDESYKDMPEFETNMEGERPGARARKALAGGPT